MSAGADVVIHSVHKTLPAMTQTALLHVQGEIANRERIRKFLSIYQSSSPSYVLMASIDACVDLIERDGEELFAKHVRELKNFRESCRELKWLYLAGLDSEKDGIWQLEAKLAEFGQTADFDRSKLLISARRANLAGAGLTGEELSRILRERYHIQMEMCIRDRSCLNCGSDKPGLCCFIMVALTASTMAFALCTCLPAIPFT